MKIIVEINQSTYVPGIALNANVILCHELAIGYGREGVSRGFMVK